MKYKNNMMKKANKNYQEVDQLKLTVKFIIWTKNQKKTMLNPGASEERLLLK
jgi:hypothetical protein